MTEEIRLQANGLNFRALAAGAAAGEPVLLLHGFPEGAESWLPQLRALAEAGFRAVAPDLRGYGGTDCPEEEEAYSIEALVADVRGLVEAIGGPAHVAGHDWGALVGWPFVSQQPGLARSWTALSVGHPVALAEIVASDEDQRRRSAYVRLFRTRGRAEEVLAEDGFRRLRAMYQGALPEDLVDRYVRGLERPGRLAAALSYYRRALPEVAGAMREVEVRTVLCWGDRDPALGRRQAEATGERVKAPYALHVLEGAGHWLQYERPGEVASVLLAHCQAGTRG